MKPLFICTGNTCRSPMAEGIYNAEAEARGLEPAESAGVAAADGDPVTENAVKAAAYYGADISAHRARRVTAELLDGADAVYCMTRSNLAALSALFPQFAGKYRLLEEDGIPDPYGGSIDVYLACAAVIKRAVYRLIEKV